MLEVFNSLASYGFFSGGTIGNIFAQWQAAGVFSYILPFLLIFALVFVILSNIALFKQNKGVNVIIALAVSLMSLQFDFVSRFFSEIFPNFGIALAVILVFVILGGLFFDAESPIFKWFFAILGLVIAAIVVIKSFAYFGVYTGSSYWWNNNWQNFLWVGLIIGAIIAIVAGSSTRPMKFPELGPVPVYDHKKYK